MGPPMPSQQLPLCSGLAQPQQPLDDDDGVQPCIMSLLPDDVLLMVMEYLVEKDILACRLVCRRFRDLTEHRAVWRRREVSLNGGASAVGLAPLRFAPCLSRLFVDVTCWRDDMRICASTKCAVSELLFVIGSKNVPICLEQAGKILRNQEALGRLRELTILEETVKTAPRTLVGDVERTSGLGTSTAHVCDGAPEVCRRAPHPSLKTFRCFLDVEQAVVPFCEAVLSTHASTLEEIHLNTADDFFWPSVPPILASMPNLSVLFGCPLSPGLGLIASCRKLESVTFYVPRVEPTAVQGVATILDSCRQLHFVYLTYSDEACVHNVGADLVLSLVSSGPSPVETLGILVDEEDLALPLPMTEPLCRALPLMPNLVELTVSGLSPELLMTITPRTVPALSALYVFPTDNDIADCAHCCLHLDSVAIFLTKNPTISLHVFTVHFCHSEDGGLCVFCANAVCHRTVWSEDVEDDRELDWVLIPRHLDETGSACPVVPCGERELAV